MLPDDAVNAYGTPEAHGEMVEDSLLAVAEEMEEMCRTGVRAQAGSLRRWSLVLRVAAEGLNEPGARL